MFYGTYKLMMEQYPSVSSRKSFDTDSHPSADIGGRRRSRRELLATSDRQLADMGFSRKLLEQGVKAWPWRVALDSPREFSATSATVVELAADRSRFAEDQQMNQWRHAA